MALRALFCHLKSWPDLSWLNIQQLGHSMFFEEHPSLLPDGRIMYDRWFQSRNTLCLRRHV